MGEKLLLLSGVGFRRIAIFHKPHPAKIWNLVFNGEKSEDFAENNSI